MTRPILVGFQTRAVPGFERLVALPPPPDLPPAELEDWRNDPAGGMAVMREAAELAATTAVTARLTHVVAVDPTRQELLDTSDGRGDLPPALRFVDWLLAARPLAFPDNGGPREVSFWGFGAAMFARILGAECALRGKPAPVGMWVANHDCHDPYELILNERERLLLPLPSLLAGLGIQTSKAWRPRLRPSEDARLVMELMTAFRLLPTETEAPLEAPTQDPPPVTPSVDATEAEPSSEDEPADGEVELPEEEPEEELGEETIPEPPETIELTGRRRRVRRG